VWSSAKRPQWVESAHWQSVLPTRSWSNFHDIEIGGPLALQACERSVPHCASKVVLTLFQGCGTISGGHRILAQLGIVDMVDLHRSILINCAARESR
jgi:hypothetical protein